jgi:hypothetical protein
MIDLYAAAFSDANTLYIGGSNGSFYRSMDAGASWMQIPLPSKQPVKSICFTDKDYGWIATDSMVVMQTKTAGASWFYLFKGSSIDTFKTTTVSFCDRLNGIVGRMVTSDGGLSWKIIPRTLVDVDTPKNVFAGKILGSRKVTPNRHVVYTLEYPDINTTLSNVYCIEGDSVHTLSSGRNGLIFNSVSFGDADRGTAVGREGMIYQTTDFGLTWQSQDASSLMELYDVAMPLSYVASTSGVRGTIFRRTNTPPVISVQDHRASGAESLEAISVYPNPGREVVKVVYRLTKPMPLEMRVYDERGATMAEFDLGIVSAGEHEAPLLVNGLSSGSYVIELRSAEGAARVVVKVF